MTEKQIENPNFIIPETGKHQISKYHNFDQRSFGVKVLIEDYAIETTFTETQILTFEFTLKMSILSINQ